MYIKKSFTSKNGKKIYYLLYLPKNFNPNNKYPFLLHLHGAGERGNVDGSEIDLIATKSFFKGVKEGKEYPFIMVAPHCPKEEYWGGYIESIGDLLDFITSKYNIDSTRRYLTGLSMGGFSSYLLAMYKVDYFAAIGLACPSSICWYSEKLVNTPVMVYHGDKDDTIDVQESINMVKAINKRGGNATLHILNGVGHEAWLYTFDDKLVDWLMSHRRG